MSSGFNLPFTVRSTIRYDSGLEHILLLLSTPIDDVTSYFTFVVWRNDDFSISAEEIIRFDLAIGAEDKRMLEQLDGVLPLDQTSARQRASRQVLRRVAPPTRRLHQILRFGIRRSPHRSRSCGVFGVHLGTSKHSTGRVPLELRR